MLTLKLQTRDGAEVWQFRKNGKGWEMRRLDFAAPEWHQCRAGFNPIDLLAYGYEIEEAESEASPVGV